MIDKSKRKFLSKFFIQQAVQIVQNFEAGVREAEEKEGFDKFFESYDSCYALALAYPDDILIETARLHGIETKNRDKIEIVKELFMKKGGYD